MMDEDREFVEEELPEFIVEEGVPIPPVARQSSKYPWAEMRVGSSFFLATTSRLERFRVQSAAMARTQQTDERYTVRNLPDGIRVWRVE